MQSLYEILSSINEAVWTVDVDENRFIYVNNRFAELYETGFEAINDPDILSSYIHPDDLLLVQEQSKKVHEGNAIEIEYRITVNNKTKWIRAKQKLVFEESIQRNVIIGIASDISSLKIPESSLIEPEKTFRYLFLHNPNPLWIYDRKTLSFLAVNHAAIDRYGYSEDEFLNMTIADIRPEEDIAALRESVKKVKNKFFNPDNPWRHLKKNGDLIHVIISGHGIKFRGRNAELVMAHDITSEVESRQKITLAKENLDALINNIEDNIWSIDSNYKILSANNSFNNTILTLIGRSISPGESIFMHEFNPKDNELWKKYYDRALNGEAFQFVELVNIPPNAPFSETKLNPIQLNDNIIGVACISSNIQSKIEAQKHILEHNKRLLELISIASHEIRGPVASLLGLTNVFNTEDPADPFNAEVIQFVQIITRQLDKLLHTLVDKTCSLQQKDMTKHYAQQNRSANE